MSIFSAFDHIENKHTLCRGKDCMQKFCSYLREHATNILNFEKKKNVTVNKRRVKITVRCKKLLYLRKKNLTKVH